jgi:hypothetical protein
VAVALQDLSILGHRFSVVKMYIPLNVIFGFIAHVLLLVHIVLSLVLKLRALTHSIFGAGRNISSSVKLEPIYLCEVLQVRGYAHEFSEPC